MVSDSRNAAGSEEVRSSLAGLLAAQLPELSGFCSTKRVGVRLFSPGEDAKQLLQLPLVLS